MSAIEIAEGIKKLPVWVVHGMNWSVDVPLDEYQASFDAETQAYEAASMALMVFKGSEHARQDIYIIMSDGKNIPFIGTSFIVHLKGTDPVKGMFPLTHVVLANQGFYNESRKMETKYESDLALAQQEQIKREEADRQLDEQLKNLKKKHMPPTKE